jgi:uncharacterized ParB-like nuclease family protein
MRMRCNTCGMKIKDEEIIEGIDGRLYYFCCDGCRDLSICKRVKIGEKLKKRVSLIYGRTRVKIQD